MYLANDILQLRVNFEVALDNTLSIVELNENILEIAETKLENIKDELMKLGKGGGTSKRIDNSIALLENLRTNDTIVAQQEVIREQVIVLFIGLLENYLGEAIKLVGNVQPNLFDFKDHGERITFTQDMLKGGFSLGDAILEHILNRGYSLQDLQSTLKIFNDYLSIDIALDTQSKDDLILCAASRNCIVHNMSKIDRKFIKQIRDTIYSTRFRLGDFVDVDHELIMNAKSAITDFADQVVAALSEQDPT